MIPSRLQLVLLSPSSPSSSHHLPSCTPQAPSPGARYLLLLGTRSSLGNSKLFLTAPPRMVRKGTLARVKKLTCPSCGESTRNLLLPFSLFFICCVLFVVFHLLCFICLVHFFYCSLDLVFKKNGKLCIMDWVPPCSDLSCL